MAVYYNHTLVIGSIHTELTVCELSALPHVWTKLTDTHAESQNVLYQHTNCIDHGFAQRYCEIISEG